MFKTLNLKNIKNAFILVTVIYCFFALFIFQDAIFLGVKKGFRFCFNLLVPSLFLFMVFSHIILNINFESKKILFFKKISNIFFKLPGDCFIAILTGLLGGYPTGAVNVKYLLKNKKITKEQARCLAYFLIGAGPAFTVNVVGILFFGSRFLGILIFLSQFLASLTLGFIISRFFFSKEKLKAQPSNLYSKSAKKNFFKIFIDSVNETSKNLFYMCSFVIFFSAILNIIQKIFESKLISSFLNLLNINKNTLGSMIALLFEVTSGCNLSVENHLPIYFLIFAISWGGISVHMQVFYILKDLNFSKFKFMFFRLLHSVLSTMLFYFFLLFSKDSVQTIVKNSAYKLLNSSFNFVPSSIFFIIMCVCFILELTEKMPKKVKNKQQP